MAQSGRTSGKSAVKVNTARYLILGFVALVGLAVVGYGLMYSTGATEGEFVEGKHYDLIEDAPRRRASDPLMVTEFFSYGCVHCKNFDPLIEKWKPSLPSGAEFERAPVTFNPAWELLARTYLAFETMDKLPGNHERVFRAIHDNGTQFLSADQLANFAAKGNIDKAAFLAAFNSTQVNRRLSEIELAMSRVGVRSVPQLVVAGKYRVNNDAGRKVSLAVVDHLIALELGSAP